MSAAMGFFPWGLKNEFEIAVVNEPSVFEPLKFYCTRVPIWNCNSPEVVYGKECKFKDRRFSYNMDKMRHYRIIITVSILCFKRK